MVNFIIVEDNDYQRSEVGKLAVKFMMKNKLDFDVKEFPDINRDLSKFINSNSSFNNIYILDFELPSGTAIDIARKIRKNDWLSPIIILTAHGGMALEVFKQRLQILDFVCKQFDAYDNLLQLFEVCIEQMNKLPSLKFTYKNVDYNIAYNKILYIYRESIERKIYIVTDDKTYKTNIPLRKIFSYLDNHFIYCNKSCVLNMNRVKTLCWKTCTVTFDNGRKEYLLSRTHKKEIGQYANS